MPSGARQCGNGVATKSPSMWKYHQSTGDVTFNGEFVASGYSGKGKGLNNPAMQGVAKTGPLPVGRWKMVEVRDSQNTGPFSIVLHAQDATPGNDTHDPTGRGAFRIHGDNSLGNRSASMGCIILPLKVRKRMWNSGDRDLEVVP